MPSSSTPPSLTVAVTVTTVPPNTAAPVADPLIVRSPTVGDKTAAEPPPPPETIATTPLELNGTNAIALASPSLPVAFGDGVNVIPVVFVAKASVIPDTGEPSLSVAFAVTEINWPSASSVVVPRVSARPNGATETGAVLPVPSPVAAVHAAVIP
jgi:hypothetical protein